MDLRVLYGQPAVPERGLVEGPFRYGERMRNVYIPVLHKRLILHTGVRQALTESDLVVVQQGNTLLLNYALIALRGVMGFRLAFWGHGKNFQTSPGRLAEKWKRIYSRFADHWFAYNDLSKRVVTGFGFPEDKITSVGNTIDIDAAVAESDSIGESELSALRNELGIQIDAPVGICCSRLYEAKGLPFLFRSMEKVRAEIPEFHLIVVGDGPFREVVAAYAGRNPSWVHWVGPAYGRRKALYFKV
ncbi:MAG: hypothetical protein LAQ30_17500, partial [Acidobacteriia bacterium]|nr:hypothetical protein [Terriglobia bacterium]